MTNREIAVLAFAIANAAGKNVAQIQAALDALDAKAVPLPADVVGTARTDLPVRDAAGAIIKRRIIVENVMGDGTRAPVSDDMVTL